MRFLRAFFFFATAVCSAAVQPDAASGAPTLLEHEPVTAELADVDALFSRQAGGGCMPFPVNPFRFHRRAPPGAVSIQETIDNSAVATYYVDGVRVVIQARNIHTNYNLGVNAHDPRGGRGHIVLVNYRNTLWRTPPRHSMQVNYENRPVGDCVRLPRLDGTWYIQMGSPNDELKMGS
ncbi:hypothetical protein EsDP_00005953 [Epichloe bromicola]|uniref:Uncharacterized protein n=1 Tax=Epichloe bromicola TaxID=79588 RepID=A0ABQ0CW63_9HYPO